MAKKDNGSSANLGFETQLWEMAESVQLDDAIRANMRALGYGQ